MRVLTLAALLILSACTSGRSSDYLTMQNIPVPTEAELTQCYNYGCQQKQRVEPPSATLKAIKKIFTPASTTTEQEQSRISQSIQIFEQDMGEITGTKNDIRGTFMLYGEDTPATRSFQLDCVDESTNTTTYLTLLNNLGYLKFYTPVFPAVRQPLLGGGGWWHQTAVIQDKATGEKFAVDSWFEDNGAPPYIISLNSWKKGWHPDKNKEL